MHMLVLKNYYMSVFTAFTAFSFVSTVIKYIPIANKDY